VSWRVAVCGGIGGAQRTHGHLNCFCLLPGLTLSFAFITSITVPYVSTRTRTAAVPCGSRGAALSILRFPSHAQTPALAARLCTLSCCLDSIMYSLPSIEGSRLMALSWVFGSEFLFEYLYINIIFGPRNHPPRTSASHGSTPLSPVSLVRMLSLKTPLSFALRFLVLARSRPLPYGMTLPGVTYFPGFSQLPHRFSYQAPHQSKTDKLTQSP